jgi:exonuclease III
MTSPITFLQFNCNGIQSSKAEIQDFLINHHVKVAAIQETKYTPKSKSPVSVDYNFVRKNRPVGRGGSLAFLIHNSVQYTNLDTSALIPQNDVTLELQGISACMNNS